MRQAEKLLAIARRHQLADISFPRGDGAGEGGGDPLKGLQVREAAHIRARGFDGRGLELQVGFLLGGFLLADTGGLEQVGPAGVGGLRQREGGFGLGELAAGLGQFLVQLRRVNLGQQIPRLDLRADVHEEAFEVTAGAGVNGCFHQRLGFGGQDQAGGGFARGGRHDTDAGNGEFPRLGAQGIAMQPAGNHPGQRADDDEHGSDNGGVAQLGAGTRRGCRS